MAAAVGRGRSRGIRGTRPPGVASPTINSQSPVPSPPPPTIPAITPPVAAVNPFVTDPAPPPVSTPAQQTPQDIATSCLNVLRNPKRRNQSECYRDCIEVLKNCLGAPENSKIWVEKCIQDVYGDVSLSQEFVQLLSTIQADKSIPNSKEVSSVSLYSYSFIPVDNVPNLGILHAKNFPVLIENGRIGIIHGGTFYYKILLKFYKCNGDWNMR